MSSKLMPQPEFRPSGQSHQFRPEDTWSRYSDQSTQSWQGEVLVRDSRFLIVSVLNNIQGKRALEIFEWTASALSLKWVGTLESELEKAGILNWNLADQLTHQFALLEIEDGSEAVALGNIFRFECGFGAAVGTKPSVAVEPDYILRQFTGGKIGANYHLRSSGSQHDAYRRILKVDDAHSNGIKGADVTIAVIDSGVEAEGIASDFRDLQDLTNRDEIDANGHGTAMATIIQDIAPEARRVAIRISNGFPRMWKLMEGIAAASFQYQADIINLSAGLDNIPTVCLNCGHSSPGLSKNLENFLSDIANLSVGRNGAPLLVASTGNEALSTGCSYPASWDFTIAIGSMNSRMERSRFSNYSTSSSHPAFFVMPGGDEDAAKEPREWVGKGDDAECLGTSPAAAYASGMLALYYSDPNYRQSDRLKFVDEVLGKCDSSFKDYREDEHGKGYLPYVSK